MSYFIHGIFILLILFILLSLKTLQGAVSMSVFILIYILFTGIRRRVPLFLKYKKYLLILLTGFCLLFFSFGFQTITRESPTVKSYCVNTCPVFEYSIYNIFHEYDLISIGMNVAPFLFGIQEIKIQEIREFVQSKYSEIMAPSDFTSLPLMSVNGMFSSSQSLREKGHYYVYTPEKKTNNVIIFLHGSAGNFQIYLKILSKIAEKNGTTIIAPSFGFGIWNNESTEMIKEIITDADNKKILPHSPVYTAIGLSNGGRGISRLIEKDDSNMIRNIVYISAVLEPEIIASNQFQKNIKNKKITIIHGKNDFLVPLRNEGFYTNHSKLNNISTIELEANHLLFFTHFSKVKEILENQRNSFNSN
jgi:predicted esterase